MIHPHYAALFVSPIKGWRLFREPYVKFAGGAVALVGVVSAVRLIVQKIDDVLSGLLH